MLKLYKNVAVVFLGLAIFTSLIVYLCLELTFLSDELLPAPKSAIPWELETASDAEVGGSSSISVNDSTYSLDFNFYITKDVEYPYASLTLVFNDVGNLEKLVDFSPYSMLSFDVKCALPSVLTFAVLSFDEEITKPGELLTYRIPTAFFSCQENWAEVEIDLRDLEVPVWWLNLFNVNMSSGSYHLDKVAGVSFGITTQSPFNTPSNVKISGLALRGRNWQYVYVFSALVVFIWGGFVFWFFKQHKKYLIANITEKLLKDRPLIAYQQLSIQPYKDEKKSAVLRFMATEYANPHMSMEMAKSRLGVNRTKINEILKEELDLTFIAYLNKLRLSEAARLLSDNRCGSSIAEIAYSVGYNNVPYFNKLFKSEYGCTPKAFRAISRQMGKT